MDAQSDRLVARPARAVVEGDGVSIVAPSSPFDREKFEKGLAALRSISLTPRLDAALFSRWPEHEPAYLAGNDEHRATALVAALRDPTTSAIVLARGGYGAMRIAAQLPLEEIARANKLLVGYSDATVLHELWARAGVPSIHGPMCTQLGEEADALSRLAALLFSRATTSITWKPLLLAGARTGTARGTLRGGNLATLASLCGTPLAPRFDGCIVLLEDLGEPPYRLDRLCTQLLQSGAFTGARGIVVGDLWSANEQPQGRAEVLIERFASLGIPLAFGAPFGHAGRNQPVAFGCQHELNASEGTLTPLESPTTTAPLASLLPIT